MKLFLLATLLCAILSSPGCSRQPLNSRSVIEKSNAKYKLTCLFYVEKVDLGDNKEIQAISKVVLRDDLTGKTTQFEPIDASSLYQSQGFFTDVWSPDKEYLALPLGRFEGFALFRSHDAMNLLTNRKSTDFIRVQTDSGVMLWHNFKGWSGESSLRFDAGLSNEAAAYQYEAAGRTLIAAPPFMKSNVGINFQGEVSVSSTNQNSKTQTRR